MNNRINEVNSSEKLKKDTSSCYYTFCPLEPEGSDKIGSLEVDLSTGEYYCHNCHAHGNIADLDDDIQEAIQFGDRLGEIV